MIFFKIIGICIGILLFFTVCSILRNAWRNKENDFFNKKIEEDREEITKRRVTK
jgi:hypothetical protein